jgi:hypothetical protein
MLKAPRQDLHKGVRAVDTITASVMISPIGIQHTFLLPLPAVGYWGGVWVIQNSQYFFKHNVGLRQYFVIPESDNSIPFRLQKTRSFGISRALLRVLTTIQLDDKPLFETDKVDDVWSDRMLPPKLEPAKIAIFQSHPQPQLGVG